MAVSRSGYHNVSPSQKYVISELPTSQPAHLHTEGRPEKERFPWVSLGMQLGKIDGGSCGLSRSDEKMESNVVALVQNPRDLTLI